MTENSTKRRTKSLARKVYYVYAPKDATPEEIRKRCLDFKKRQDAADERVERERLNKPVFVPTSTEWKQLRRKLGHMHYLNQKLRTGT